MRGPLDFHAAYRAAHDEAGEEVLAVAWDQVSRSLPPHSDIGAVRYTQRPWVGPSGDDETRPRHLVLIEYCGNPPLGALR